MLGISRKYTKLLAFLAITAVVSGAVFWLLISNFRPYVSAEYGLIDEMIRRGKKSPWNDKIVFLAIDQRSRDEERYTAEMLASSPPLRLMASDWPWKRSVYGYILDRLSEAGARAVVFDLMFPTESEFDGEFADSLERHRDIAVIGFNFIAPMEREGSTGQWVLPAESLVPHTDPLDSRVAYVNFWPQFEWDGVIRQANYNVNPYSVYGYDMPASDEELFHSLAAQALTTAGYGDRVPSDLDSHLFRWAPPPGRPGALEIYSVGDLFDPDAWKRNFDDGKFFEGKIVVVGPDGNWLKDEISTPFGVLPGPMVHLNAMNAAMNGDFLHMMSPRSIMWMLGIAAIASLSMSVLIQRPMLRFAAFWVASGVFVAVCMWLFNTRGTVVLLASPLLIFNGSGFTCLVWEVVLERIERVRTRRTLERYVSKNVVKDVLDNPATYLNSLGGVRKPVTLLFTDLRGFTTLTESAKDESELVSRLNEYFSAMVHVIFENGGTLDKFMGDAIMAVWGNVESRGPAEDTCATVNAAIAMMEALERLNVEWAKRRLPTLAMGVGINQGEVIFGNIGSQERMEPTVIGDAVNLGSRLEGLTKEFGVKVLIGENAAHLVGDRFHLQKVANVQVKGKTKPIEVFTLIGPVEKPLDEGTAGYLAAFAEGVRFYEDGDFERAAENFESAMKARPGDPTAGKYIDLCGELKAAGKPENWNGVFVMKTK